MDDVMPDVQLYLIYLFIFVVWFCSWIRVLNVSLLVYALPG